MVREAQRNGIIQVRQVEVTPQITFSFYSLHLEVVSYESLLWILESFKVNELKPTVKAIKRYIKDAYGLNLQYDIWNELFLESIKTNWYVKRFVTLSPEQIKQIDLANQKYKFHKVDINFSSVKKSGMFPSYQVFEIVIEND